MEDIAIPVILLLIGSFFTVVAWGRRNYERGRRTRGVVMHGRIVDSEWDMNSTGAIFQAPIVEYVDDGGATRRFTHRAGSTFRPSVGAPVDVWLDPATGEGPVLHEDRPMRWVFWLFGVVGLVADVGAVLMLWSALR